MGDEEHQEWKQDKNLFEADGLVFSLETVGGHPVIIARIAGEPDRIMGGNAVASFRPSDMGPINKAAAKKLPPNVVDNLRQKFMEAEIVARFEGKLRS